MRNPLPILCILPAIALVGCHTNSGASGGAHGMGMVPPSLIELYDIGDPEGVLEIEIDRDGSIVGLEADVSVSMLPDAVLATVMAEAPGGRVTGAEREQTPTGAGWEVKLELNGVAWEYVVGPDGKIVETEQAIAESDAPDAVLAAADRAVPKGSLKSVEIIRRGSEVEYHVKKQVGTTSYKVVIAPDGTVLRAVREARAEIEIPLAK